MGLSYTTFEYGKLKVSSDKLKGAQTLTASIEVKNTGKVDGKEIVQLYIRDMVGTVTRPVKELKGFQKVMIKAGETKTIEFKITPEDLKFYNSELKFDWESGDFQIMIGKNSQELSGTLINWQK
jgi:beta-glucosidase